MKTVKTFKFYKVSEFSEPLGSAHNSRRWGKFMGFLVSFCICNMVVPPSNTINDGCCSTELTKKNIGSTAYFLR